jgi:GntP family gluconate:H+ symporter
MHISTVGAILGLVLAIVLIIKKLNPTLSLIVGAVVGGVIGGIGLSIQGDISIWDILPNTVNSIIGSQVTTGIRGVVPAIVRIVAAGVLAGVLIQTGAAQTISSMIIKLFGAKLALLALALSGLVLTAVGVFIDVAVVTIAPIAISISNQVGIPKVAMLLALIGGSKAGNVISPNPNTIIAASNLNVPLFDLMVAGLPAAIVGLIVSVLLGLWVSRRLRVRGAIEDNPSIASVHGNSSTTNSTQLDIDVRSQDQNCPKLWAALVAPVVVICLLGLNPILSNTVPGAKSTTIDPLIALPIGGVIGCLCMGKIRYLNRYVAFGIGKMMPIVVLFVGTGAIAGIIQDSNLSQDIVTLFDTIGLSIVWLASLSGVLFSAATGSTTSAANIASASFVSYVDGQVVFVDGTVSNLSAAAMIHSGAATLDHLPHGTFFHATGGAANMDIKQRLVLIPYETIVGVVMTIVTTIMYGLILS